MWVNDCTLNERKVNNGVSMSMYAKNRLQTQLAPESLKMVSNTVVELVVSELPVSGNVTPPGKQHSL